MTVEGRPGENQAMVEAVAPWVCGTIIQSCRAPPFVAHHRVSWGLWTQGPWSWWVWHFGRPPGFQSCVAQVSGCPGR